MKRNWKKRSLRTFIQAAASAIITGAYAIVETGDVTTSSIIAILFAGLAAGFSAIQNAMENTQREGPIEED